MAEDRWQKGNRLIHGDCLEVMAAMPDNSVNVIITDPPYYTTNLKFDREAKIDFEAFFAEAHRICKPEGSIVSFAQQPFATDLICANRRYFRYELIWEKTMAMGFLNAKKRPLRAHENILVFSEKGFANYNPQKIRVHNRITKKIRKANDICQHYNKKKVDYIDDGTRYPRSVLKHQNVSRGFFKSKQDKSIFHPTQKPLDLIRWLVLTYTNPGEIVFDPFAGSATTAVAAMETNRRYIAVEKDLSFFEQAQARIEAAVSKLKKESIPA